MPNLTISGMGKKLSVSLMMIRQRENYLPYLKERLGDVPVAMDDGNKGLWNNCKDAWLMHDPDAEWHVVIQDDALICDEFIEKATAVLEKLGNRDYVVAFYVGDRLKHLLDRSIMEKKDYVVNHRIMNEVALCMRTKHIKNMVNYCDMRNSISDRHIQGFAKNNGLNIYYPIPSLIDHRLDPSVWRALKNKPLVDSKRQAAYYIDRNNPFAGTTDSRATRFIIMADGIGKRWKDYMGVPKHLIPINGEPLIARTVRLLGNEDIIITSHDPRYNFATRYEPPNNVLEIDRFFACQEIWVDHTVFIYGDVYYTPEAIAKIKSIGGNGTYFFGRRKGNKVKDYGEIFAVRTGNRTQFLKYLTQVREGVLKGTIKRGIGWDLWRAMGRVNFVEVDKKCEDFDKPDDFEKWRLNNDI